MVYFVSHFPTLSVEFKCLLVFNEVEVTTFGTQYPAMIKAAMTQLR